MLFVLGQFTQPKGSTTRWSLVSWTMNRKIQMFTVAFMVNESHSKHLNFAVHGSWDQRPPCGATLKEVIIKETDQTWSKPFIKNWQLSSKLDSDHTWLIWSHKLNTPLSRKKLQQETGKYLDHYLFLKLISVSSIESMVRITVSTRNVFFSTFHMAKKSPLTLKQAGLLNWKL